MDWRTKSSSAAPTIATAITATANQNCAAVVSGSHAVGTYSSVNAVVSRKSESIATPRSTGGISERNLAMVLDSTPTTNHRRLPRPNSTNNRRSGCSTVSRRCSMYSALRACPNSRVVPRGWPSPVKPVGKARTPDRFLRLHHRTRCSHRAGTVTSAARRDRRVRPRTDSRLRSTPTLEGGSETPRRARRRDRRVPPCPRCGSSRRRSGR